MESTQETTGQLDLAKVVLIGDEEDLLHPGYSSTLKHDGKRFPSVIHYAYSRILTQLQLHEEHLIDLLSTPPTNVVARALQLIEGNLPTGQDLTSLAPYIQNWRQAFLLEGYKIRAEQDENFKSNLKQTNDALLIVCDPKDPEMGIGMSDSSFVDFYKAGNYKMQDLSDWMLNEHVRPKAIGQNQVGFLLMYLRFEANETERLKLLKNKEFTFQGLSTDMDDQPMKITASSHIMSLSGILKPLSNYYKCTFEVKEKSFRSVEHYAFEKLLDGFGADETCIQKIRSVPQPADVRHVAGKIMDELEIEDDEIKRKIGKLDRWRQTAMKHKVSKDIELQKLLLSTGNAFLVECNPYGDDVWTVNTNEYELQHLLTKSKFDIDLLADIMTGKKEAPPTLKHLGKNKTGILLMELRKKYHTTQYTPYPLISPPEVNIQRMGPSNNIVCFTPESIFHPFYPVKIVVNQDLTLPTPIHYVILYSCRFFGIKASMEEEFMSYLDGADVWYRFNDYINNELNISMEKIKHYYMMERHKLIKTALGLMFMQHPAILRVLLETEDALMVYCSRYSTIECELTCGLREKEFRRLFQESQSDVNELINVFLQPIYIRPAYIGGNRLGFILMELRRSFTLGGCYPSQYDVLPMTMEAKLGTNSPMENYTCDRPFIPLKRINFLSKWADPYILYYKNLDDYMDIKKNMPVMVPENTRQASRLVNEIFKEESDRQRMLRGVESGIKATIFNALATGLNESLVSAERKLLKLNDIDVSISVVNDHFEQLNKRNEPPPVSAPFPSLLGPPIHQQNQISQPQQQNWRDQGNRDRKNFARDGFRNDRNSMDRNRDRRSNYNGQQQNRNGTNRSNYGRGQRRYSPTRENQERKRNPSPEKQDKSNEETSKVKKPKRVVDESELSEGEILSSDED